MTKSDSSEAAAATRLLDGIRSPADIKTLGEADLPQLAQEVREELIKVLSQTGGHLGPNLGVVELTIALHRVFETPRDKFVFDVSHQGYVHKMFTGRLDRIGTMRQYEGLNGFLLRTESEHDCYGAGHAGTALSAGLGMAVGRDLRRVGIETAGEVVERRRVVARRVGRLGPDRQERPQGAVQGAAQVARFSHAGDRRDVLARSDRDLVGARDDRAVARH